MALKNLDIKIKKGEFVCLIGDVGSGKSSFLSALLGDLLYLPQHEYQNLHSNILKEEHVKQAITMNQKKELSFTRCFLSFSIERLKTD